MNNEQLKKIEAGNGFIAALDQSGGSTPAALELYGVDESAYSNNSEMFDRMHEMRTRIITSPSFTGDRILGAILFEMTMDRTIEGKGSAEYLWQDKGVVPFVKVDKGLAAEADGSQVMKPMPELAALLTRAKTHDVFGTKMRSVIKLANSGRRQGRRRPAVRGGPADSRSRPGPDHRAGGRHPQPGEDRRGGTAEVRCGGRARSALR